MSQLEIITGKKPDVKRLMLAVAMTAVVVNSAWAETPAAPKPEVTVSGAVVTVGDVFSGVTHDAGYVLAPAPGPGGALTLNAHDLQRVSEAFHLGWAPSSGLEQAVIRRLSHDIDRYAVEAAVEEGLAKEMKGQKFEIELANPNVSFHLPEGMPVTAETQSLRYDLGRGEFRAVLVAPAGSASPAVREEISGRLYSVTSVPVLKNPLRQGDIISAADIDYIDMRADRVSPAVIVDADKLVGMSPRRGVAALKPVAASEIILPVIVKKGDLVVMALQSGSISLSTLGKALDNGAEGETVRVQNSSSNQVVQAVVTGPKAVSVSAPGSI